MSDTALLGRRSTKRRFGSSVSGSMKMVFSLPLVVMMHVVMLLGYFTVGGQAFINSFAYTQQSTKFLRDWAWVSLGVVAGLVLLTIVVMLFKGGRRGRSERLLFAAAFAILPIIFVVLIYIRHLTDQGKDKAHPLFISRTRDVWALVVLMLVAFLSAVATSAGDELDASDSSRKGFGVMASLVMVFMTIVGVFYYIALHVVCAYADIAVGTDRISVKTFLDLYFWVTLVSASVTIFVAAYARWSEHINFARVQAAAFLFTVFLSILEVVRLQDYYDDNGNNKLARKSVGLPGTAPDADAGLLWGWTSHDVFIFSMLSSLVYLQPASSYISAYYGSHGPRKSREQIGLQLASVAMLLYAGFLFALMIMGLIDAVPYDSDVTPTNFRNMQWASFAFAALHVIVCFILGVMSNRAAYFVRAAFYALFTATYLLQTIMYNKYLDNNGDVKNHRSYLQLNHVQWFTASIGTMFNLMWAIDGMKATRRKSVN